MNNELIRNYEASLEAGSPTASICQRLVIYYRRKRLYDDELRAISQILQIFKGSSRHEAYYINRRNKAFELKAKRKAHFTDGAVNTA